MIRKIVAIKNVGRFRHYSAVGDVEFRRLTVLYGENGRGKTTLAAILRSLKSGAAEHVLERRSLGSADAPHVHFLIRGGVTEFKAGAWSALLPVIEVFDESFVHRNVYAGDSIGHDHKKNLYRVIVGEEGVTLAAEVDALDARIKDANKRLADLKASVTRLCPAGMDVDAYVSLAPVDRIDEQIDALAGEIAAHGQESDVRSKPPLSRIDLPALPPAVTAALATDVDAAAAAAEGMVRDHIARCVSGGESWLAQGAGYVRGDACPFCGGPITASELVRAYGVYFGAAYRALTAEVAAAAGAVESAMGDKVLLRLQRDISDNLALHKFWNPLTNLDLPDLAFETLQAAVERLRAAARGLLEVKSGRILEAVEPGAEFETAVTSWGQAASAVRDYNRAVGEIAAAVAGLKARGGTDAGVLGSRLDRLRGAKARHSDVASGLCDQFAEAGKAKKALEADKKTAKRRLEEYTATVFGTYQSKINELLGQFNAGFRIADTKGRFVGGSPSSSFVLVINNEHVVLDDDKAGGGSPCFKNTLSAGDRSALAFAFFLARLHDDPGIGDKIVVIDDPITSQDSFRTTCTRQLIVRLYSRAKQVIVLSHNQAFLRNLWENMVTRDVKPLRIGRDGDQSTIAEWDIECDTRGVYLQNYHDLAAYLTDGTGERRHVARCIRVLLEEYFRMKAPRHFTRTEWLGYFIDKVRGSQPGEALHAAQHLLAELEDINGYSKRYHHAENPGADSEQVDDTELQGFVRRTIALVSRF